MFFWFVIVLAGAVLVGGAGLCALGIRGRVVDSGPRCRRCGYDLTGSAGARCSECGADLAAPRAVLALRRQRSFRLFAVGFVGLVLGVGMVWGLVSRGSMAARGWYRRFPTGILLASVSDTNPHVVKEAVTVLRARLSAGALSRNDLTALAEVALREQQREEFRGSSSQQLLDMLGVLQEQGLLTERQEYRLFDGIARVTGRGLAHVDPDGWVDFCIPMEWRGPQDWWGPDPRNRAVRQSVALDLRAAPIGAEGTDSERRLHPTFLCESLDPIYAEQKQIEMLVTLTIRPGGESWKQPAEAFVRNWFVVVDVELPRSEQPKPNNTRLGNLAKVVWLSDLCVLGEPGNVEDGFRLAGVVVIKSPGLPDGMEHLVDLMWLRSDGTETPIATGINLREAGVPSEGDGIAGVRFRGSLDVSEPPAQLDIVVRPSRSRTGTEAGKDTSSALHFAGVTVMRSEAGACAALSLMLSPLHEAEVVAGLEDADAGQPCLPDDRPETSSEAGGGP